MVLHKLPQPFSPCPLGGGVQPSQRGVRCPIYRLFPVTSRDVPGQMPGQLNPGPRSCPGQLNPGPRSCPGQMNSGPRSCPGQMNSGPRSCPGQMNSGPRSCPGEMNSGHGHGQGHSQDLCQSRSRLSGSAESTPVYSTPVLTLQVRGAINKPNSGLWSRVRHDRHDRLPSLKTSSTLVRVKGNCVLRGLYLSLVYSAESKSQSWVFDSVFDFSLL